MGEIIVRIPWNKKIALRIVLGIAIALPILYIIMTHGITKYRPDLAEGSYDTNARTWVVTLRDNLPFESAHGSQYKACINVVTGERVYVNSYSSGFSSGSAYYSNEGDFISNWSLNDTGQVSQNGEYIGDFDEDAARDRVGENLNFCKRIPKWFFNIKVDA